MIADDLENLVLGSLHAVGVVGLERHGKQGETNGQFLGLIVGNEIEILPGFLDHVEVDVVAGDAVPKLDLLWGCPFIDAGRQAREVLLELLLVLLVFVEGNQDVGLVESEAWLIAELVDDLLPILECLCRADLRIQAGQLNLEAIDLQILGERSFRPRARSSPRRRSLRASWRFEL